MTVVQRSRLGLLPDTSTEKRVTFIDRLIPRSDLSAAAQCWGRGGGRGECSGAGGGGWEVSRRAPDEGSGQNAERTKSTGAHWPHNAGDGRMA